MRCSSSGCRPRSAGAEASKRSLGLHAKGPAPANRPPCATRRQHVAFFRAGRSSTVALNRFKAGVDLRGRPAPRPARVSAATPEVPGARGVFPRALVEGMDKLGIVEAAQPERFLLAQPRGLPGAERQIEAEIGKERTTALRVVLQRVDLGIDAAGRRRGPKPLHHRQTVLIGGVHHPAQRRQQHAVEPHPRRHLGRMVPRARPAPMESTKRLSASKVQFSPKTRRPASCRSASEGSS